jgi:PAS domain S-box-containing protein
MGQPAGRSGVITVVTTIVAIVIFALFSASHYAEMRRERWAMTAAQAEKTLLSFEAQSRRLFDYSDGVLRAARHFYTLHPGDGVGVLLHDIYAPRAETFQGTMTIANSAGAAVFHSDGPWTPGADLSGREYFQTFKRNPADFLYVGPTDFGKITRQWWFRLVRPILKDGGLDGVVIMTLRPENITAFYQDLALGAHSTAAMMTLDGRLIARQPAPPLELYGTSVGNPALWSGLERGPSGSYHAANGIDGIDRTYFFKRLDDYPVIITVGVADQDVEATLAATRANVGIQVLAFSLAAAIFCLLMLRMQRKNRVLSMMESASATSAQELGCAMADLSATAARLELVVETAAEGIVGLDDHGVVVFANLAASQVLGWAAAGEMVGCPAAEALGHRLSDGKACGEGVCSIRATLADGVTRRVTSETFLAQDGRCVPVDYAVSPLIVDGAAVGAVLIFHDVSTRRDAEAKINNLLSYQRAILDNAPVGIAIFDHQRRLTDANPALFDIFGWTDGDLRGRSARCLYCSAEQFQSFGDRALPLVFAGKSFRGDTLMCRQDGREIWVRLTGHLVDVDNPRLGVIWAMEDITERKALELDLTRSNQELERFAYVASHDLRQPLRMVSSYLALLERRLGPRLEGDEKDFIAFAVDGAKRMDRMIIDLLDYSRIGRSGASASLVPLDTALARAVGTLQAAIAEARAEVVLPQSMPAVLGHASELERLFQNLISNAIKFRAPDRTPTVKIECRATSREWIISVADNGIGIAPEDHSRLFGVFQRLVRHDQYDGNGIGLAACRKIAEHHGGRIWVESEARSGSTFLVALPLGEGAGE